jgi:tetratricopeptide (TPR) repeat protein
MLAQAAKLRADGKGEEAAAIERAAITALMTDARHREALATLQKGDSFAANSLLKTLIDEDGDDVVALAVLGNQAAKAGQYAIAESMLRSAVDLAPGYGAARLFLADLLHQTKKFTEALRELDALPDAFTNSVPARSLRADCLGELGKLDEQIRLLRALAEETGDKLSFNLRIGHALRALGDADEAARYYREVLEVQPGEGTSWWSLANLKAVRFDDADLAAMRTALAAPANSDRNRIRLHFALARALEERGEAAESFRHYDAGNRLRDELSTYDPAMISQWVERNEAFFTQEFYDARRGMGEPSHAPIFVIGMQRSGSTLIEQILASHPEIEGTAELPCLPNLVRTLGEAASARGRRYEDDVATFTPDRLAELGRSYLADSAQHRHSDEPRFTDKMPNNWMHVSLIRLILPNAKIIDVRREPMDCCFSNWRQLYARGLDHSNRLDTMGRYYADYVRLMRHFDRVQPGAVHRIIHDDLIADTEGEVRRLFAYLGIAFDPAVLDFHRTERAVRTISASQVRKPLNKDGVGRWKAYERWLGPLKSALGDTLDDWRS